MPRRIRVLAYRLEVEGQLLKAGSVAYVSDGAAEDLVEEGKAQYCDAHEVEQRELDKQARLAREGGSSWYHHKGVASIQSTDEGK